jgi:hypothetical protein
MGKPVYHAGVVRRVRRDEQAVENVAGENGPQCPETNTEDALKADLHPAQPVVLVLVVIGFHLPEASRVFASEQINVTEQLENIKRRAGVERIRESIGVGQRT